MFTPTKVNIKPCSVLLEPITPKAVLNFSTELRQVINERNILTTKTRRLVSADLKQIEDESKAKTQQNRRDKLITEIIQSEEEYVRQLELILEFFMKPARDSQLLKPEQIDVLFGNIQSIYRINKELLEQLHKGPENVAVAFSHMAPWFKCYSFYASGFKSSLEVLHNSRKHSPKFLKFVESQESRPEVQSKLSGLLIAPIQRVPRYQLLLNSLKRSTSPLDDSYPSLLESLVKVKEAADHINKVIEEQENMQRLIELQRCFLSGVPNIIIPGRKLIKEGELLKICPKTKHSRAIYIVLANDIIMYCKMKNRDEVKTNSLKCSGIYPLGRCTIKEILDKGSFKIICDNEEIALYHESFSVTLSWIEEIKAAIQTFVTNQKTLKKENTIRRPVKRKDLAEYNDVGISPGKRLKKRNMQQASHECRSPSFALARRRPLRTYTATDNIAPLFVTLKPKVEENRNEDVFVFGKPQPDRGFSFRMNKFFSGIGSSVKRLFGFD